MAKFESKTGFEGVRLGLGRFFTNNGCDFRFSFVVWFCSVVGVVLFFCCDIFVCFFFNFESKIGFEGVRLCVGRFFSNFYLHVCDFLFLWLTSFFCGLFFLYLAFAGFVMILLSFCFLLRVEHVCGLRLALLDWTGGLGVLQNGVGRCCVILFKSKTVCLIGCLFSNFYVVHGSYIIKEKYRKITGVTLLRKLTPVPLAGFIVILIGFWFVLSFYTWFSFAEVDWEKLRFFSVEFSFAEFDREKLRLLALDYKVMARVADKIKLIDGSRGALKLSVRITDLWFIGIPGKTEQAEMVVVDSNGDEIHVVCKQDQLKSRKANLKENLTYVMHNFKVIKNDGKFRVCDHEYKLCFTGVTVVRQCDMEQLPFRKFRFVAFSSVIVGHFKIGLLVDVIGVVDEVVFRYVSSKNTGVVLNLNDLSGQVLSCTLWENYCLQFLSYLNDIEDERPIVILLTHARIKEAQGSYLVSINNSFKASKLMINDLMLEIQEFRESLLDLGIEVRSILTPIGQRSSQVSGSSQLSSKDVFLSKTEEFVCVTIAKITTIVMDNYSWCYPACAQCYKKTEMQTMPFTCPCGKENDQPVLRYRVEVMVNHKGEQAKFLIWDHECAQLIGQSVDEVNRLKIEDGDVDLNASPQALDRLLGCFLAFKVKVQPRFRNSVVLKYSDESDLINVVLDMIPDSEPCCKIENSILESIDPTVLESQSLSITANHDGLMLGSSLPTEFESVSWGCRVFLLMIPLTSTKRVSSDELDNERKNFQISPAEVSSNKLAKHSQPE
ncbi:Replication factor A protein 1 [Glycine soja]